MNLVEELDKALNKMPQEARSAIRPSLMYEEVKKLEEFLRWYEVEETIKSLSSFSAECRMWENWCKHKWKEQHVFLVELRNAVCKEVSDRILVWMER